MTTPKLPLDAGLLDRFRRAGGEIAWRDAAGASPRQAAPPKKARAGAHSTVRRIAHLNDEEATVERSGPESTPTLVVDSGPVGALVLLLEMDRRGLPHTLTTHEAGDLSGFPTGALEASWAKSGTEKPLGLPISDLVGLARYALA